MNKELYYTPTIEEFHVGFEFEKYDNRTAAYVENNYKPTNWHKFKYNLESIRLSQLGTHLYEKTIRVKYLDQSDIESLGWKLGILRLFNKDLTVYGLDKHSNYILTTPIEVYEKTHIIDISRVESIGKGLNRVFRGTIKNKSELKLLMKQLGINE